MTLGSLAKKVKNESPRLFRDDGEASASPLSKLFKQNRNEMLSFPVIKFWEKILANIDIANSKNDSSFVQFFKYKAPLKENVLVKSIQLSDSAEILVTVNLKKKNSQDRNTSRVSHDESSMNMCFVRVISL